MPTTGKQDASGIADTTFIEPAAQHHYKFKEPWTVLALDNIQGFLIQLACGGGAGAIAKTAVAPLERVKVNGNMGQQRMQTLHCVMRLVNALLCAGV
jgi:hypothetical protein